MSVSVEALHWAKLLAMLAEGRSTRRARKSGHTTCTTAILKASCLPRAHPQRGYPLLTNGFAGLFARKNWETYGLPRKRIALSQLLASQRSARPVLLHYLPVPWKPISAHWSSTMI